VPLAQPRSLIFGHFFSGLVGVIIKVIFHYRFPEEGEGFPRLMWLAACLATSIALVVMHLTKTTHPPAGATALLPCVDPTIHALGWYFLPVLLLSSALLLVSALLVNNIQRQYPKFWIAPIPPAPPVLPKNQHNDPPDPEKAELGEARKAPTLPSPTRAT
jgi:CBS-domain-containing membrane protein